MEYLEKGFRKNSDIVSRKIDDEFILVPICKAVGDVNCIYTLNETGASIWQLIDGKRKLKEMEDEIFKEYEVDSQVLEKDIEEIMKEFEEINCILEVSN